MKRSRISVSSTASAASRLTVVVRVVSECDDERHIVPRAVLQEHAVDVPADPGALEGP